MSNHFFDIGDAKVYGVDQAIILGNMRFWLDHNKANKTNVHYGYYWTYNSAKAFAELFPYWSSNKLQKLLKKMEIDGVIITGEFNKKGYDRTKWYTMPAYAIQPNGVMYSADPLNASSQTAEPIPDINTDNKPDKKTTVKPESFKQFFEQYPDHRKGGTDSYAWKKWKQEKLTEGDASLALSWILKANAIPGWRESQYRLGIPKFIEQRIWLTPIEAQKNEISTGISQSANSQVKDGRSYADRQRDKLSAWYKENGLNEIDGVTMGSDASALPTGRVVEAGRGDANRDMDQSVIDLRPEQDSDSYYQGG